MNNSLIKCAVVDDSHTQRMAVVKLIKKHPQLLLVNEWNNVIEAKNGMLDTETDVLFLDIEMPILSGFNLLDDLENKPHVIVVTGKAKYAHKAFDYDVLDFLKKPLKPGRFNIAIEKVIKAKNLKISKTRKDNAPFNFIRSGVKKHKVFLDEVLYISAMGDFAKIHLENNKFLIISGTMTYLSSLLPNKQFFRAHRSFIVNLEKIERFSTRYIEIKNDTIPISRQKTQGLKEKLGYFIPD